MHFFKKYEVADKAAAKALIDALPHITNEEGIEIPSHRHTIVELGHLVQTPGVYDEQGNEITPPVLSPNYAIDVLWFEEADTSWDPYLVTPSSGGVHTFAGWTYTP